MLIGEYDQVQRPIFIMQKLLQIQYNDIREVTLFNKSRQRKKAV